MSTSKPTTAKKAKVKFVIFHQDKEDRDNYNKEKCWYCGKSRQCLSPKGCTLTHKYDLPKDAMYPEQDPYKRLRDADGKIKSRP